MLVLQVWPQYLSLSTAYEFHSGKPDWKKKRAYYMRNISTFEPFVESITQLIIKLCIWTFFNQNHLEQFQGDTNPLFKKTWEQHLFVFTTCVSGIASVLGIIRFFKDGPVRFLPQTGALNGIFTFNFIFSFFATLFNALSKILLLIIMLYYSLGVLQVFTNPPVGQDLVGTVSQPKCSNITIVQACLRDDTFQVRTHFPDEEYKMGVPWKDGRETEWRVFLRNEIIPVRIFWDANKADWVEAWVKSCLETWDCESELCRVRLTNNCGTADSIKTYCSESVNVVTLSRLVAFSIWFGLNILPQFLLATLALLSIDVKGMFQTFLHFPELMLSPTITNMIFGPKNILWKNKSKEFDKSVILSPELYWINNLLSLLGNLLSLVILYLQFCEADPQYRCLNKMEFWDFLKNRGKNQNNIIALPPGLVIIFHIFSVFLSACVIHFNSYQSSTSDGSFWSPLEFHKIEISSCLHRLKSSKKAPNENANTETRDEKMISQMQHMVITQASRVRANEIEISNKTM